MSTHPDTIILSDWFDRSKFLSNIPQPACIIIDRPNVFHKTLPNIFIQIEPSIICDIEKDIIANHDKYHMIFTFNKSILENCKNAKFYIFGTCWIPKEYYTNIDISKKMFKISTLAGSKNINNAPGHLFRQIIHNNQNKLVYFPITFFRSLRQYPQLPDYGNNPFLENDSKIGLFDSFQFSIIIENSQQINYFTEKLIDCLITKTIPIYWGCPNISDFFNTNGWILLNTTSIEELYQKMEPLTDDYYNKYINEIEENYLKAISYSDLYTNINNVK